jgi:hypothetical protein
MVVSPCSAAVTRTVRVDGFAVMPMLHSPESTIAGLTSTKRDLCSSAIDHNFHRVNHTELTDPT